MVVIMCSICRCRVCREVGEHQYFEVGGFVKRVVSSRVCKKFVLLGFIMSRGGEFLAFFDWELSTRIM